jgi:hypothetical protein
MKNDQKLQKKVLPFVQQVQSFFSIKFLNKKINTYPSFLAISAAVCPEKFLQEKSAP